MSGQAMRSGQRLCVLGGVLATALWLGAAPAAGAEPGGQGTLKPGSGVSRVECFPTGSQTVSEVCGVLQVRWKLTSLMGEPVANFGLAWSLTSVRMRVDKGPRSFAIQSLPEPLARAAQRSELMVHGLGTFVGNRGGLLAVDVDTGAPVAPDGKLSFNVPGSPDWARFIISGGSSVHPRGGVAFGQDGWCEREGRAYLTAAAAKEQMRQGIKLSGLVLCPRSSASASALERALQQFCEQSPAAMWCERKPEMAHADALDRVADTPEVRRVHARLVGAYRGEAERACRQEMAPVLSCQRQQCPDPTGPDEAVCQAIPAQPWRGMGPLLTRVDNGPCNARCQREREIAREEARREREAQEREFEAKEAAWTAQWGELSQACRANREARTAQAQCVKASAPRCNPVGLTPQACLERRMAAAPTLEQARALFAKESAQREQAGERQRFLD